METSSIGFYFDLHSIGFYRKYENDSDWPSQGILHSIGFHLRDENQKLTALINDFRIISFHLTVWKSDIKCRNDHL